MDANQDLEKALKILQSVPIDSWKQTQEANTFAAYIESPNGTPLNLNLSYHMVMGRVVLLPGQEEPEPNRGYYLNIRNGNDPLNVLYTGVMYEPDSEFGKIYHQLKEERFAREHLTLEDVF
ncbi:TPA: hypothetical protein HA239_00070 [Candidatus Woesearchaeota archaeon]|nr:hypothetical protein QT06_C0001G1170 [archaeon GW2011_AR15]MBS3104360.1 hypothetical protein [Candidatus Woesearchaeota archaeon]HIH40794.1 hypothetical protein [Candidatus Woesearchaeota archaeon]